MKKIYFFAAAAALVLTACDNDNSGDTPTDSPSSTKLRISASIDEAYLTRAQGKAWGENDHIGIITTIGELAPGSFHPYVNLDYVTANGGENASFTGPEMLFYNHLTISGYHPYQGSEGTAPGGSADGFLIKTDTQIDKQFDNNKAIDFLYATKTGIKLAEAKEVQLAFSHKMTKLTFKFMSNSDKNNTVNVANLAKYQIEGLVMEGSFDTLSGECMADSDKPTQDLVVEDLFIPLDEREQEAPESRTMDPLIVFPQTPEGDVTLRIFLDEARNGKDYQIYFCTIKFGDKQLKPGYHYIFKVNVTKAGLQLGEITIADWGKSVPTTIIATIDGEEPVFEESELEEND